jgi:glycosyltransferase involved in cell wall biosynthesis
MKSNKYFSVKQGIRAFMRKHYLGQFISRDILEIGSGRDEFNRTLFEKKYKVITCNIYPQNVVDHICSVTCLPFKDNQFGCVICEHVLEHVEEPKKAIEEISRVLKPQGLLLLVTPFSWPIHDKPFDLWRFSEEGLRHLLMYNFTEVKFQPIGNPTKPRLFCVSGRKLAARKYSPQPKVSVIMPTYNRAHMIGRAIESVLKQTFKDWELIIVNDGSTDNTKEVVERFKDKRIVYLERENGGPAAARNLGLRHARGEYVAYCDSDDTLFPYHLETLVKCLDRNPEVGLARGASVKFEGNKKEGFLNVGFLWSCMHRLKCLKKTGFFDEKQLTGSDIEFLLRFSDFYLTYNFDVVLARYGVHKSSHVVLQSSQIGNYNDRLYVRRVKQVCESQKITKQYFLLLAYFLLQRSDFKAALKLTRYFMRRYPCAEATYLAGWTYYRIGNLSGAINTLKKTLQYQVRYRRKSLAVRQSLNEYVYTLLSWIYSRKSDTKRQALEYAVEGLRRYPTSSILQLEAFHGHLNVGQLNKALDVYRGVNNRSTKTYFKGVIALSKGDYRKAKKHLIDANKLNKALQYRLYSSLVLLHKKTGKIKEVNKYQKLLRDSLGYIWGIPIFTKENMRHVEDQEFIDILGRIFLLAKSRDARII